jgi:hypothetical protein
MHWTVSKYRNSRGHGSILSSKTRTAQKMMRPAILLLLSAYSLPRWRLYRTAANTDKEGYIYIYIYIYIYRHTDWWKGFMKYAVEVGSGAMTYIQSFIKIGWGIQNLISGFTQTHRQHGDLISLLLFFNKENRLIKSELEQREHWKHETITEII